MIHIFKNLNFGGLLALVAGVVLMVSWTSIETKKTAPEWHVVTITNLLDPHNPANQRIDGPYPGGTPDGDCVEVSGHLCAQQIDMKDYEGTISTLAEAEQLAEDEEIELGLSSFKLP